MRFPIAARFLIGLFVASILLLATSAQAGFLPNAARVRVTSQLPTSPGIDSFQVAEIEALEAGTGINVASQTNGGVANASSVAFGTIAGDANDGNTNGAFGGGSVWHSAGPPPLGEFVEATFAGPATLDEIQFFGRTDCCQNRQDNFLLEIFDGGGGVLFSQAVLGAGSGPFPVTIDLPTIAVVPEPPSMVLAALGLLGMGTIGWRRRTRS